jgi:hypothetical protein
LICIPCVEPEVAFLLFQPEFWLALIAVILATPVVGVMLFGKTINWLFWRMWALHQRRDVEDFLALAGAPGLPLTRKQRVVRWLFPKFYSRFLAPRPPLRLTHAKLDLERYEQTMMLLSRRKPR